MPELRVARSELILGGQKSGKTARAEALAARWLSQSPQHEAMYIATAQAWDAEMRERIARHRRDRAERVSRMRTVEEPLALAQAIGQHSRPQTLIVVDCLTLWLTARLMPAAGLDPQSLPPPDLGTLPPSGAGSLPHRGRAGLGTLPGASTPYAAATGHFPSPDAQGGPDAPPDPGIASAIAACAGPLVLISNEIGMGVIPLGRDVRQFVDALGTLNQQAAAACERVTLMSAGLALTLKGAA